MDTIVMTTIHGPSQPLLAWLRDSSWNLVVVLDRKSPVEAWTSVKSEKITVLDLEQQIARFPKLAALLPENSYSRKNFGFLEALHTGADVVWELDDDNFPIADPRLFLNEGWFPLSRSDVIGTDDAESEAESLFPVNLFPVIYDERCWPRGFPLDYLQTERGFISRIDTDDPRRPELEPELIQFGVNGEPDFDAIFRLSHRQRVWTARQVRISVPKPFVAPCNTQNTLWVDFPRAVKTGAIFHPCTVHDRFSDILKGYIAQVFFTLGFGPPTAYQARNEHSFFEDFRGEMEMYFNVRGVLNAVEMFTRSKIETAHDVIAVLANGGIVNRRELDVLDAFLDYSDAG